MNPKDSNAPPPAYLTADQLRIGVFVMIELPWLKHEFAVNNFKIRSEAQLRDLRALGLKQYRYDPSRSEKFAELVGSAGDVPSAVPDDHVRMDSSGELAPQHGADLERQKRIVQNLRRRENVEQVEKAFVKAVTVMKNLNRNIYSRPKETLEDLGSLIGDMTDAFMNCPGATLHVMGEKSGNPDVYFHSLNVTILAMMLAKELEFTPADALELGIGAMIHDIGLADIPDRVVKKSPSESSRAEINLRATHVEIGVNLGKRIGLSEVALSVISQHHELVDGSGYPKGLKAENMTAAARLVSVVNYYDNLCNPPDITKAMTPHEALSHMFAQYRSKFDSRALQLLIRSLGVHPPGSIVQLSNQSLAVVTAVNPKKPLRPWVLVYDENTPKEEAITIDLAQEPTISILKAIRPSKLSPKVAAYLNHRKRVTYFFDGDHTSDSPGVKK